MAQGKPKFRHELKYLISEQEKDILIARIKDILRLDPNAERGRYMIRSLYFDDYWNSAYEEKISGTLSRKKYRIRIYNYSDHIIKLECKNKQGSYIFKEAAILTREEVTCILQGDYNFLLEREESVCKDFYIACSSDYMRPRVIVDYDRIPYIYAPGDVRVTFDQQIRVGMSGYDIFDTELPMVQTLPCGELIMEVKYTEYLPQIIKNVLSVEHSNYIAASKYCMCYEKKSLFMN